MTKKDWERLLDKEFAKWIKEHGLVKTNADPVFAWKLGAEEAKEFINQFINSLLAKQKKEYEKRIEDLEIKLESKGEY